MVLKYWINTRTYDIYYNLIDNFIAYVGVLVVSLLLGLISTVLIELPFSKLAKDSLNLLIKRSE